MLFEYKGMNRLTIDNEACCHNHMCLHTCAPQITKYPRSSFQSSLFLFLLPIESRTYTLLKLKEKKKMS